MLPVVLVVLHVVHRPNHLVMKWTLIKHTHTHAAYSHWLNGLPCSDWN